MDDYRDDPRFDRYNDFDWDDDDDIDMAIDRERPYYLSLNNYLSEIRDTGDWEEFDCVFKETGSTNTFVFDPKYFHKIPPDIGLIKQYYCQPSPNLQGFQLFSRDGALVY